MSRWECPSLRSILVGEQAKRRCMTGITPLPPTWLRSHGGIFIRERTVAEGVVARRRAHLHNGGLPEQIVRAPDPPQTTAYPARLILILSLAPTIGLGIGRFAYALVLPDMRDALHWSYSAAGFMNTINAVGYLAGALLASRIIKQFGLATSVRWSTIACVIALALSGVSGNFILLSFARLLIGFAAALVFVGGGALAATIAQSRPERANFLLSLFYAGPGIGILASGLIAPYVLQAFGPGSWWIVWWALTALSVAMLIPLLLVPLGGSAAIDHAARVDISVRPVLIYLAAYFLFGAGYIAYMTFMIAWVRDGGGGAGA